MKKRLIILGIISLLAADTFAQTASKESKYSIETDILWPFFPGASRTQLAATLWEKGHLRGDILVGVNVLFPKNRETEGRFADYSLVTGYRQYLWKGLHLEFSQTTGLGVLQNHVTTGKTYRSFDWAMTGYIGYRFSFAKNKLYVIPQFGVEGVVYKSNPWPIYEDKTLTKEVGEYPFMLGSLRFVYKF